MLKKLILGLMILGFAGTASAAEVFAGTWRLNVAKSKFSPGPAPKSVTVVIAEKGADFLVSATGTDAMDKPFSIKYSFPLKGGPIAYTEGAPAAAAKVVIKRPSANTIDGASTLDGKETGSSKTVLAADGKSFTRTVKTTGADGKPVHNTELYEKQ